MTYEKLIGNSDYMSLESEPEYRVQIPIRQLGIAKFVKVRVE